MTSDLQLKDQTISLQDAQQQALRLSATETQELTIILDRQLPDLVARLDRFKADAREILSKINTK